MIPHEAIVDLWEFAGEPSDLDPWVLDPVNYDSATELDPNSQGVKYYLKELSKAQVALSNWKTRGNRPVRFKHLQVSKNFKLSLDSTSYSCTRLSDDSIRILTPPAYMLTDTMESARCEIIHNGTDGSTLTDERMAMYIEPAPDDSYVIIYFMEDMTTLGVTEGSTTVSFTFDRFNIERGTPTLNTPYLLMPDKFRNILKVTDYDSSAPLLKPSRKADLLNTELTTGTPTQWYSLGEKIFFDVYFEEPRWFRIEYQKLPENITTLTDLFDVPEQWHEILLLIVQWQQAKRSQENEMAARYRSDIDGYISRQRLDSEEDYLRQDTGYFKLRIS